ncbi:MAG: hypothetical protein M1358_14270, partial [Chloroflexi bacterium]|nr:hypothetical protein [Chloroflexota bacterium]
DGKPDPKLAGQVKQAQATVEDLEAVYQLLTQRHRDALLAHLEAEAAQKRTQSETVAAEYQAADLAFRQAQGAMIVAQAQLEAKRGEFLQWRSITPRKPLTLVEGLPSEIRTRVATDPTLTVDLYELEAALLELEAMAKERGFDGERGLPGNKVERVEGIVYFPVAGKCRIEWGPQTGQVTVKNLLSVLALEANNPDAKPVPLPEPERIGAWRGW